MEIRAGRGALFVRDGDHAARGDASGEPVAAGEAQNHGDVVLVDAVGGHGAANHAGCLDRLFAHDRLLDGVEVLQGVEEAVHVLGAAHLGDEVGHLLGRGEEALVLVVVAVGEEGDELTPRALRAERGGDRGQAPDRVETELNVLVLRAEGEDGWSRGGQGRVGRGRAGSRARGGADLGSRPTRGFISTRRRCSNPPAKRARLASGNARARRRRARFRPRDRAHLQLVNQHRDVEEVGVIGRHGDGLVLASATHSVPPSNHAERSFPP